MGTHFSNRKNENEMKHIRLKCNNAPKTSK